MFIAAAAQSPAIPAQKPDDAQTVKDFTARVSRYLDERKKQAGTSPRPSNSPEKLDKAQQVVAAKSQDMRVEAKQGDIFSDDIAAYFRRQIAATLSGPKGTKIRASLRSADPVRNLDLHVNQKYPHGVPLQSTPASLLLNLRLPKEPQYRIVGRRLVLLRYDSQASCRFRSQCHQRRGLTKSRPSAVRSATRFAPKLARADSN
jgi:hypothetical protein